MLFDPATRTGLAMLWNSDANLPSQFPAELMDRAYGSPFVDRLNVAPSLSHRAPRDVSVETPEAGARPVRLAR